MQQASENGSPVMRPLFYDFPEDPASWEVEDSYMFGPDPIFLFFMCTVLSMLQFQSVFGSKQNALCTASMIVLMPYS